MPPRARARNTHTPTWNTPYIAARACTHAGVGTNQSNCPQLGVRITFGLSELWFAKKEPARGAIDWGEIQETRAWPAAAHACNAGGGDGGGAGVDLPSDPTSWPDAFMCALPGPLQIIAPCV